MIETTVSTPKGDLRAYDTGDAGIPLIYHHGTPNIGPPPQPLHAAARELGLRWLGFDRPGYGGSERVAGRRVSDAAETTLAVADALGLDRFAVWGHSGGGPHALAAAHAAPERVIAVVSIAGLAPMNALGRKWFKGMEGPGAGELKAAIKGGEPLREYLESTEFDPVMFTDADLAALEGEWSWFNDIAAQGVAGGLDGSVDDDVAYVAPWGFDPAEIVPPTLIVQGEKDRVVPVQHGRWLADAIPGAQYIEVPDAGHISVLSEGARALEWVAAQAQQ